jgi:hypothetical protein
VDAGRQILRDEFESTAKEPIEIRTPQDIPHLAKPEVWGVGSATKHQRTAVGGVHKDAPSRWLKPPTFSYVQIR